MKLAPLVRLMNRESRGARGRLVFMTLCLALGVAAVTGVAALVASVEAAVQRDARSLLAADVSVEARRVLPEQLDLVLEAFESSDGSAVSGTSRVTELGAMVSPMEGDAVLAELKGVDAGYPLRGAFVSEPAGMIPGALADDEIIAAPELLAQLGAEVGGEVSIGGQAYRVVGLVADEPDRVDFAMTLGPRVFVSRAGLERTGLMGFGSRIKSKRLVRFDGTASKGDAAELVQVIKAGLGDDATYLRFKTFDRPSPGLTRALENIGSYLGLVALLSLVLGGIGVAQVVRAWLGGRGPAIATLRSLGFRPREVFVAYLGHVALLALLGCVLGVGAGLSLPYLVRVFEPDLFAGGLPALQWGAAARGLVLGLGTALVFAVPPLLAVWRVSPARVLRSEAAPLPPPRIVRVLSGVVLVGGVFAFALLQSGSATVAAAFTGGLGALVAVLMGAASLTTRVAARMPRSGLSPTLRHGVAALARPGAGALGAAVALGLGTLVVVALGLVGARMQEELANGTPADAPTVFLVDVQPDQWDGVAESLAAVGATNVDSTPVVMARLASIAGKPLREILGTRKKGRSRWQLTREQRLTWAEELPGGNELVEGQLWQDDGAPEVSVEVEFAKSLGVGVGDSLGFDVQGQPMEFKVTSLREVDWASFRINFFLLVEPGVMEGAPGWRLAAATVPAEREVELQNRVVGAYPNVSVLRLRPLLEKVSGTLGKIALSVRLLGGFAILTGIVILAGAVAASSLRRGSEAALLKSLGVTRRGVASLFAVEFGLLGAVAGLLGGIGALLLAWVFLSVGLEMRGMPSLWSVFGAAAGTAALAVIAGLGASRKALASRPLDTLRT